MLLEDNPHDQLLRSHVGPTDWTNPEPSGRYNLVVVGAGTAGLVAAAGAAGLGAKVALVERSLMGGDCLNVGCVPSKAVIAAARAAAAVRDAGRFGVKVPEKVEVDFGVAFERMRKLRSEIAPHDSAERFRELGVDVYLGSGRFVDRAALEVDGVRLEFSKAIIATGARAAAPPIPGLDRIDYLTNESVFSLTELPSSLGIIGAGPIGCELAQTFARLGSEVLLVEAEHGIMPREDGEASAVVAESMRRDGVRVMCCGKQLELSPAAAGAVRMQVDSHDRSYDEVVDRLLVAVGRKPNTDDLGLEAAGVEFNERGVRVDDRLRTSNKRIFAAGDICSRFQFTHAADFLARIAIQNALFMGRSRASALSVPWATYTEPELAQTGYSAATAAKEGIEVDVYRQDFAQLDRSILEGETEGFVKVLTRRGSDRIVGATIVGANAGDLVSELSLAMDRGIGLKKLAAVIHPYPTRAEAIRKLGDQYNRTRLTPLVKRAFRWWLRKTR